MKTITLNEGAYVMGEKDYFKCKVCGALIDPEKGETYVSENSNAHKIGEMKEKYVNLKNQFAVIQDENERLLKRLKNDQREDETDDEQDNQDDERFDRKIRKANDDDGIDGWFDN